MSSDVASPLDVEARAAYDAIPNIGLIAMNRRRWKRLGLLAALPVIALVSYRAIDWLRWREQPDSATRVAVELRPAHQVIKIGEAPDLSVTVVNHGGQEVILVEPGDGSDWGWRTPVIEWSSSTWFRGPRCGNVNALKPEDVFTLKPGESRRLGGWVGVPQLRGHG